MATEAGRRVTDDRDPLDDEDEPPMPDNDPVPTDEDPDEHKEPNR